DLATLPRPWRAFSDVARYSSHRLLRGQKVARDLAANVSCNSSNRKHRVAPPPSKAISPMGLCREALGRRLTLQNAPNQGLEVCELFADPRQSRRFTCASGASRILRAIAASGGLGRGAPL